MTDQERYEAELARVRERASNAGNVLPSFKGIVWVWLAILVIVFPMMH